MVSSMTDSLTLDEQRHLLGQETYVDFLEWKLYHSAIDMDDLENEIRIYKKLNGHLEVKALLIGAFYKRKFRGCPRKRLQRLKDINQSNARLLKSCRGDEKSPPVLVLWAELRMNWLGTLTGTGHSWSNFTSF